MRKRQWGRVLRSVRARGRYYVQEIIPLLGGRRMQWQELSRELRACNGKLQGRNQEVRQLRRELAAQTQRANRLAKRNQRMVAQTRNGGHQPQNASDGRRSRPPVGRVDFGSLRRVTPISALFGYERGQPIDRYYIENFLAHHADDIQGRVLEIGDDFYTRKFGGGRVEISDVLHVTEDNPRATIVADLTRADHIPSDAFDCIIFTQTLQFIYDVRQATQALYRILKPGGVLLATVPGIGRMLDPFQDDWGVSYQWAFTVPSVRRLFEESFPTARVEGHGNVLAAISFLHGLAAEELRREELDHREAGYDGYEVLITLRAVKPQASL